MGNKQIDQYVEILCQKGCRSVREDIQLLEQGVILPELEALDDLSRQKVLKELRAIMAVYGDSCPIEYPSDIKSSGLKHGEQENKTR
ncbi:MAG: hypothetical protein ABW124_06050 [Candidatus Thiodiazotropha sp. 6PLUC9]